MLRSYSYLQIKGIAASESVSYLKPINLLPFFLLTAFSLSCNGGRLSSVANGEKGVIDLSQHDFAEDGTVVLGGEWLFWGREFVDKDAIVNQETFRDLKARAAHHTVGTPWSLVDGVDGKAMSGDEYASYYVEVKIPSNSPPLSLQILGLTTAFELDVLESPSSVIRQGKPAKEKLNEVPSWYLEDYKISPEGPVDRLRLLFRVSSHTHPNGGFWQRAVLGATAEIEQDVFESRMESAANLAAFLVLGLYHLIIFSLRRNDRSVLWFSGICFVATIRTIFTDSLPILLFPEIVSYIYTQVATSFEYWTLAALVWTVYYFFYHAIPDVLPTFLKKFVNIGFWGLSIPCFVLDYYHLSYLLPLFQAFNLITAGVVIVSFIRYSLGPNPALQSEVRLMLALFVLLLIAGVHDLLMVNSIIPATIAVLHKAVIIFFLGQSYILARKYAKSFAEIKHSYLQLSKLIYPHQMEMIRNGSQIEDTIPSGTGNACVICFDIIGSSKIQHPGFAEVVEKYMIHARQLMMEGYSTNPLASRGYLVKEMGDGLLCSIGFPFREIEQPRQLSAVKLAESLIQEFGKFSKSLASDKPICCSVGVADGPLTSYVSTAGRIREDLWGQSLVLAVRYEAMRYKLFKHLNVESSNILILRESIYNRLPKDHQEQYTLFELDKHKLRVNDDPNAKFLAYRLF